MLIVNKIINFVLYNYNMQFILILQLLRTHRMQSFPLISIEEKSWCVPEDFPVFSLRGRLRFIRTTVALSLGNFQKHFILFFLQDRETGGNNHVCWKKTWNS